MIGLPDETVIRDSPLDVRQVRRSSIPEPTSTSSTPFASGSTHRLPARTREGGRRVPAHREWSRLTANGAPVDTLHLALGNGALCAPLISKCRTGAYTRPASCPCVASVGVHPEGQYAAAGIDGLREATRRLRTAPSRLAAETEALVCELRGAHPQWGAQRIAFEVAQRGVAWAPSRATAHRVLVRNATVTPQVGQGIAEQLDELRHQYADLQGREERFTMISRRLAARIDAYRGAREAAKAPTPQRSRQPGRCGPR